MKKLAFVPVVSAFALAAGIAPGAFAQVQTPPEVCYTGNFACRNVTVTVVGNQLVLDPANVTVTGRASPVKIVWYLATPGYRFVDDASSRPVDVPGYTKGQFMSNDPRFCYVWRTVTPVYVCTDRNDETVEASYTIKVQAASGSPPAPASGRVINN